MTITLYYMGESPPCSAVLLTLRILKLDFIPVIVDLSRNEQLKADLLEINPLHCLPTLKDDHLVLWESRAIMCYLVDKYAPGHHLYPWNVKDRAMINRMLFHDIGRLYSSVSKYLSPLLRNEPISSVDEENFKQELSILNSIIATNDYVVSGCWLTLADISIISSLKFALAAKFDFTPYSNVQKWIDRMLNLPEYKDNCFPHLLSFRTYLESLNSSFK